MQISFCDLCKEPIEVNGKKYILGFSEVGEVKDEVEREQQYIDMVSTLHKEMKQNNRGINIYEVCPKCMQIFLYFINMRKEEVDKTREEVAKYLKRKFKEPSKEDNKGNK